MKCLGNGQDGEEMVDQNVPEDAYAVDQNDSEEVDISAIIDHAYTLAEQLGWGQTIWHRLRSCNHPRLCRWREESNSIRWQEEKESHRN
jgi:hypothetical protein